MVAAEKEAKRRKPLALLGIEPNSTLITNQSGHCHSRTRAENISEDIPDDENTSVWIQGLPPNCSCDMLSASLRKLARFFAAAINKPIGLHNTSAAKVVF